MDEKPCECIVRNILVERCLAAHSLPLCIDDCVKKASYTCTSRMDAGHQRIIRAADAKERVVQELQHNTSTSTRILSQETHIPHTTVWRIVHHERTTSLSFATRQGTGTERLQ